MGSVPAAALDPIFYLHHANIDRLYECWLQQDEAARLPQTQGVLNRTFSFVDGGGAVRTRRVRDMLTTTQLGYGYAEGAGCPAPIVAAQEVAEMEIELQRGLTTVPLDVETDAAPPGALEARRAAGPAAATVVVDGLTAAKAPGVLYNVYLANDAGAREQIGVIDFFAFDDGGHEGHAGHDASARRFEFDATAAMEKLGLDPSAKPNLIFEPTTGLTNSTPEAAADAIAADADVKFRRAWLRLD